MDRQKNTASRCFPVKHDRKFSQLIFFFFVLYLCGLYRGCIFGPVLFIMYTVSYFYFFSFKRYLYSGDIIFFHITLTFA